MVFALLIGSIISDLYLNDPRLFNLAFSTATIFLVPIIMEIFESNESDNISKVIWIYFTYVVVVGISLWLTTFKGLSLYCIKNTSSTGCNLSSKGLLALYFVVSAVVGRVKYETLIEQKELKNNIKEKEKDTKKLKEKNMKLQNELDSERNKIYPTTIVILKIFKITLNKKE